MKKKNKSFGEAVAVGSALAGAALGAAAVMLSDKKNQKKIKKTIDGISHDAVKLGKNIKKRAEEFKKSTQTHSANSGQGKKVERAVSSTSSKATAKKVTPKKI